MKILYKTNPLLMSLNKVQGQDYCPIQSAASLLLIQEFHHAPAGAVIHI